MSDHDDRPVGFMGKVRNMKIVTWVLIIGLVGLTVSGTTLLFVLLNN
ncbi:MAG: hypothetical protein KIT89_12560 [Microcella sp.]|nr:hypothetical protein [Microcella sp.]UYN83497.1 MAG: hypothetical protein KIT89_12560 [Microcella sp.]